MLLLYQNGKLSVLAEMKLYIPLCFYYITSAVIPFSYNLSLHSTMLLLYLEEHTVITITTSFTFHYASTISKCFKRLYVHICNLYIPLCFYYITLWIKLKETKKSLHSTMLLLYLKQPCITINRYIFTFHYASTISAVGTESLWREVTLHSTMLLLYRNSSNLKL